MLILNDVRFIDKYDNFKEIDDKAIVTYQRKIKRKKCDACNLYYAKIISVNDIIMGDVNNALFLCDQCLENLHKVDIMGDNKDNLKLIPYYHN